MAAAKIDIKTIKMKKIFLLLFMAFALASCSGQLTEKVMATYPDGTTRVVHYYENSVNNHGFSNVFLYSRE